jgi:hypothetical protein
MDLVGDEGFYETWMTLWAGRLDGCVGLTTNPVRGRVCATGVVGVVDGTSISGSGHASVGGRVEVGWRATQRATLNVSADVLGKLGPSELVVEGEDQDYPVRDPNPIAVIFSAGVSTDFTTGRW